MRPGLELCRRTVRYPRAVPTSFADGPQAGGPLDTEPAQAPDLAASIVIPTRDRRASVVRALQAILADVTPASGCEVIVVDNGSTDGTGAAVADVMATSRLPIRLVSETRPGRAIACNTGASVARGRILILLDDDMEPQPGWLEAHLAAHARPDVAVMGAVPTASRPRTATGRYLADRFDRHLAKLASSGIGTFRDVYTGDFSLERERFLAIGGFDPTFSTYGNEDGDLAIRLGAAGVPIVFAPDAVARQHQDKDLVRAVADATSKGRNAVALGRRHPDAAATLAFSRPGSRRRRASRRAVGATLGWIPRLPRLLEPPMEAVDHVRPGLARRAIEAVLDAAYWRGVDQARRRSDG